MASNHIWFVSKIINNEYCIEFTPVLKRQTRHHNILEYVRNQSFLLSSFKFLIQNQVFHSYYTNVKYIKKLLYKGTKLTHYIINNILDYAIYDSFNVNYTIIELNDYYEEDCVNFVRVMHKMIKMGAFKSIYIDFIHHLSFYWNKNIVLNRDEVDFILFMECISEFLGNYIMEDIKFIYLYY